jgi:2-oxoglutarate ferredoxin oxidoreductase subunit delta
MAIATSVLAADRADPSLPRGAPPQPLAIALERCKGCELCITACPHDVLALDVSVVNHLGYHPVRLTDAAGCTSCAICARVCPDAVFTVFAPPKEA